MKRLNYESEYQGRLSTLKGTIRRPRDHYGDHEERRPADYSLKTVEADMAIVEKNMRRLNIAIQKSNFDNEIQFQGESMSIAEALELRKAINERIASLHTGTVESAWVKVVHKEDRDIEETPETPFQENISALNMDRVVFRQLNCALREVGYSVEIKFKEV